jgi:hypothetical protein
MGEIHCIQLKQRNYLFLKIEYAIKLLIEILMYKNWFNYVFHYPFSRFVIHLINGIISDNKIVTCLI